MAELNPKSKAKKDILILYVKKDAQLWTDFLKDSIREYSKNLSIEVKDLLSDMDEVRTTSACFSVVLVIVSNAMLKTMESAANVLNPIFQGLSCVYVVKLYLEETKYLNMTMFYGTAKDWKEFCFDSRDYADNVHTLKTDIISILQNRRVPRKPVQTQRKSRIQSICPENIRQDGEMMTLVLRTKVNDGQTVQVIVGDNKQLLDTNKLNEFCFTFKAPAHKAGKADVLLFIDGRKISKWPVYYSSMTRFAYTYPEYLCQLIGLDSSDKTGLDKELTNIFNKCAPQDGSLQYMLTPKGVKRSGELPTLLHFACKVGLNGLAVAIIDTLGSHAAINMENERGCKPLDLAKENNNEELVNHLEAFVETPAFDADIEDLCERMSWGKKLESYMNTGSEGSVQSSGFFSMGDQSKEEVTNRQISMPRGPEEVREKDDIPPEVPRRESKKKQSFPPSKVKCTKEQEKPDEFLGFAPKKGYDIRSEKL